MSIKEEIVKLDKEIHVLCRGEIYYANRLMEKVFLCIKETPTEELKTILNGEIYYNNEHYKLKTQNNLHYVLYELARVFGYTDNYPVFCMLKEIKESIEENIEILINKINNWNVLIEKECSKIEDQEERQMMTLYHSTNIQLLKHQVIYDRVASEHKNVLDSFPIHILFLLFHLNHIDKEQYINAFSTC